MLAASVDAGFDEYENSLYDDTIDYFVKMGNLNKEIKGINIISIK